MIWHRRAHLQTEIHRPHAKEFLEEYQNLNAEKLCVYLNVYTSRMERAIDFLASALLMNWFVLLIEMMLSSSVTCDM